ncbi:MAG: hypothetical protein ABIN67_08845 [Ferruginibacter sp.]
MKKIITGMLAIAAFVFSASAQETGKEKFKQRAQHHHSQRHGMFKDLNLTAAQKEQMKANHEATKKQLTDLNKEENITVKEFKTRKEAIRKEQKEKMNSLLTPEQKDQIAKNKAAHQAQREVKRTKGLERMKTKLNLSDDQVAQLKASREEQMAKVKAIKDNEQLSQSEKKEQLMALKGQNKEAFKKILTEEQLSKMEEMRKKKTHGSK